MSVLIAAELVEGYRPQVADPHFSQCDRPSVHQPLANPARARDHKSDKSDKKVNLADPILQSVRSEEMDIVAAMEHMKIDGKNVLTDGDSDDAFIPETFSVKPELMLSPFNFVTKLFMHLVEYPARNFVLAPSRQYSSRLSPSAPQTKLTQGEKLFDAAECSHEFARIDCQHRFNAFSATICPLVTTLASRLGLEVPDLLEELTLIMLACSFEQEIPTLAAEQWKLLALGNFFNILFKFYFLILRVNCEFLNDNMLDKCLYTAQGRSCTERWRLSTFSVPFRHFCYFCSRFSSACCTSRLCYDTFIVESS